MKSLYLLLFLIPIMIYPQGIEWSMGLGGLSYDRATSISTAADGNTYVLSYTGSSKIIIPKDTIVKAGLSSDILLLKINSHGNIVWSKIFGGNGADFGLSIKASKNGYVYFTGYFSSPTITFGSFALQNNSTGNDFYLVKCDSAGNILWAQSGGGNLDDKAECLSIDEKGGVYISGNTNSHPIHFGSVTISDTGHAVDFFIAKYSTEGEVLWGRKIYGTDKSTKSIKSIANDNTGNLYLAGNYNSSILIIDSVHTLNGVGENDFMVIKYNSKGEIIWSKSYGGTSYDYLYSLSVDNLGIVYLTGSFTSSGVSFGTNDKYDSFGNDIFILKLDSTGNTRWVKTVGGDKNGNSSDIGNSIVPFGDSSIYVVGMFNSASISFDSIKLFNSPPQGVNNYLEMFIANYDTSGKIKWAINSKGLGDELVRSAAVTNDGELLVAGYFDSDTLVIGKDIHVNNGEDDIFICKTGQQIDINYGIGNIWLDKNNDGFETKVINPVINISSGSVLTYEWTINNHVFGTDKNVSITVPTGTWHIKLKIKTNTGNIVEDSIKVSVYAAETQTTGSIESAVSQLDKFSYFVTSKGGNIYSFDSTGTIAWIIQTGGSIQSTTCISNQDNIYVGSNDTRLYSFDFQGIPRWDKALGGTIVSSPSAGVNGLIYVGISTGRLFAIDEIGNVKWSVQTGGPVQSSASIGENEIVYFGSDDNKLYAVSPPNAGNIGVVLWTYITAGPIRTSPALGLDSSIVFGSDDGYLYKLNKNGSLLWKYQTGGPIKSSPIIGLDGIIYFGSTDGKVFSLSREGNKLWEFNTESAVNATPSLGTDGSIYFGSMSGTIYSLDQNGVLKWNLQTEKPIIAPMLVTNSNILMVGDTLGKVYIMKIPENGALAELNNEFDQKSSTVSTSSYEWWTFKGNNQRTGYRKGIATGISNKMSLLPDQYSLSQNYPNPFNPATTIRYGLPSSSRVSLKIYNVLGQQIADLVNTEQSAGWYETTWHANVSSGLYFYRIDAVSSTEPSKRFTQLKKMILLK